MCERHGPTRLNSEIHAAVRGLFADSPQQPASLADLASEATASTATPRRLKLWELESRYHCPVIGTCLNLADLKRIVRKQGYSGEIDTPYSLHIEAVSLAGQRNPVSELIQKHLEQRHAASLRRFAAAHAPEVVLELWRRAIARGEAAGATWAAMTHRAGTPEMRHELYAELHMLAHQLGVVRAEDSERAQRLENELAEQAETLRQLRAQLAEARQETRELRLARDQERIDDLARLAEQAKRDERLHQFESGQAFVALGRRLLMAEARAAHARELDIRNRALVERVGILRSEKARHTRELEQLTAERDAMERLWSLDSAEPQINSNACNGACDACDQRLQGRCVLCVGGRTPLLAQYRQLAERLGVRLIHHDGGQEEALSRLPELLNASDAVICPTDCVGHLAYYQLKKHCKQNGKPCVLTRNSGVSGFAAALARLADGRADIHAQA